MKPVSELDEDDADVLHHGKNHFPEVFRLSFGATVELDLIQFADTVDELCNFCTESGGDLFLRRGCVLNDVVQERCLDTFRIQVQIREYAGYSNGVSDEWLAGKAFLALMGLRAELVGLYDLSDLIGRKICLQLGQQPV